MKKLIGIIVLLVIIFGSTPAMALIFDDAPKGKIKIGLDWMYGKDYDGWMFDTLQSPQCANTVNRFSLRVETNTIFPSWDKWFIGLELQYSMHKADELPAGKYGMGHDAGFREYGFNVTIKRQFFDELFYVGMFMGLSCWYERDHGMHNLGDSHVLGSFGPTLGKDWRIYKAFSMRTELRLSHTSDPLQGDRGKNHGIFVIGATYTF